jgi:5-methylcytosine-specific restriction protein A
MSIRRTNPNAGRVDPRTLPAGANGRALCRRCQQEVPKGRRTFCSDEHAHEWRLRSSTSYLRWHVFKRDKGVCRKCGADTQKWRKEASRLPYAERHVFLQSIDMPPDRVTYWDADHILPVVQGGDECGLDGIQTLCVPCHKSKTAALARERADARRAAKEK